MGMRPGKAKGPYVGPLSSGGGGTPTNPTAVPTWFPPIYFTFANFTGFAALVGDYEIYSLLSRGTLEGGIIKVTTPFSGPGITSLQLSVGLAGDLARYVSFYDATSAASNTNHGQSHFQEIVNFGAATSIRLAATALGANLSALTAGEGVLYLKGARVAAP